MLKKGIAVVFIYFLIWMSYTNTKVFNQTDSIWSIYSTLSLVRENNLDLDEYKDLFPKAFYANLTQANGHYYNYYPYGVSLLAYPYIWIIDKSYSLNHKDLKEKILSTSTVNLEKTIAASLLALSACILFLLSLKELNSYLNSFLTVFIFAFATLNFSVLSRGLWQHTGSVFLLMLVLYLFHSKKDTLITLSAFPLFFSYVVRPTNLLPILFLGLIAIYQLRFKSIYFLGIGIVILSSFFYTNSVLFGTMSHPYYDFKKVGGSNTFLEAILGNAISPARGILFYSPVFLFSFYGLYSKIKKEKFQTLDFAIIVLILTHWILVSRNLNWWGGHCFGYRLLSDLIPFFIYYLIYFIKEIDWKVKSPILFLFILSLFISLFINLKGATEMNSYNWNLIPSNIDTDPKRLWDLQDLPFLR